MAGKHAPRYAVRSTGIGSEDYQLVGYFDTHEDAQRVVDLLWTVCAHDSLLEIVQLKWDGGGADA